MRRAVLGLLFTLLGIAPAEAGVNMLGYGIYSGQQTRCLSVTGPIWNCQVANMAPVATVTDIPGALGVMFGFHYGFDVAPNATWTNVIFPPAGLHNPRFAVVHNFGTTDNCTQDCYLTYAFDFPWEIVPGVWTMQVWADGHLVAQKQFNVYLPHKKPAKPGKGKLVAGIPPGKNA